MHRGNRDGSTHALTRKQISLFLFLFFFSALFTPTRAATPSRSNKLTKWAVFPHSHPPTHPPPPFPAPSAQTSPLCERLYKGCCSVPLLPGEGAHAAADSPTPGNPPSEDILSSQGDEAAYHFFFNRVRRQLLVLSRSWIGLWGAHFTNMF